MALVFLSHAHGDEKLVRSVVSLLRDGLDLKPDDFFVSSQGGRGVAPAASIRDEVLKELGGALSLVVVVTPKSAGSPWVWLEAGHRLGRPDASNPLFAVPSERFLPLVQPVSDLRCIRLDHEEDLHEFVKAVGQSLGRPPQDILDYNNAMRRLVAAATTADGSYGGWRSRLADRVKAQAAAAAVAERMTTKAAEDLLIAADISRKKRKGVVDRIAAAILLQSYLAAQASDSSHDSGDR